MTRMLKSQDKLNGHDLMNIGIFGAIYFVILFVVAMLGIIPIFLPLLSVFVPIIGGIPFMLFLTKVKKPGMIFITAIIMGLLMLLTGMGIWPLIASAIASLYTHAARASFGSNVFNIHHLCRQKLRLSRISCLDLPHSLQFIFTMRSYSPHPHCLYTLL